MDGAMTSLRTEFASLRTGRASASMLEPIQVDAYGQMTPINQLGTINVPEPRMVVDQRLGQGHGFQGGKGDPRKRLGINPQPTARSSCCRSPS
jgi:ribosome recycling factor